jgi:hypothetical protein
VKSPLHFVEKSIDSDFPVIDNAAVSSGEGLFVLTIMPETTMPETEETVIEKINGAIGKAAAFQSMSVEGEQVVNQNIASLMKARRAAKRRGHSKRETEYRRNV